MRRILVLLAMLLVTACQSRADKLEDFDYGATSSPCESVKYEVKVTSGRVTAIDVTLSNATGDTEQGKFSLPYRKTYRMCDSFLNFNYISSQIVEPTSGAGSIECKITVDGVVVSTAKASGFPSIAGCSD